MALIVHSCLILRSRCLSKLGFQFSALKTATKPVSGKQSTTARMACRAAGSNARAEKETVPKKLEDDRHFKKGDKVRTVPLGCWQIALGHLGTPRDSPPKKIAVLIGG